MTIQEGNEDIPMTAQGLLVKGKDGEDYLLTTEPNQGTRTHRLVVRRRVNGQWKSVQGVEEVACRESVIGAFVDFVVDLCRVLNSSDHPPVSEGAPAQSSRAGRLHTTDPALFQQGPKG